MATDKLNGNPVEVYCPEGGFTAGIAVRLPKGYTMFKTPTYYVFNNRNREHIMQENHPDRWPNTLTSFKYVARNTYFDKDLNPPVGIRFEIDGEIFERRGIDDTYLISNENCELASRKIKTILRRKYKDLPDEWGPDVLEHILPERLHDSIQDGISPALNSTEAFKYYIEILEECADNFKVLEYI